MRNRAAATCLLIAMVVAGSPALANPGQPVPQERQARGQQIPDSPRARKATTFVEAMQDGSEEALRKLVEEEFAADLRDLVPMEEHLERLGGFSEMFQEAAEFRMGPRSEYVVAIRLLDDAGETTRTVELSIDSEAPHPIVGIRAQ